MPPLIRPEGKASDFRRVVYDGDSASRAPLTIRSEEVAVEVRIPTVFRKYTGTSRLPRSSPGP